MRYMLTRLAGLPLTLVAVSLLTFGILFLVPGDTVDVLAGESIADPAAKARMAAELGLDRPFLVQYADWVWRAAQGDLGMSTSSHRPVAELIWTRLGVTVQLAILGTLISVVIGVAAGFLALRFRGRLIDRLIMAWAAVGMSIPSFVSATLIVLGISILLPDLGVVSYVPFSRDPLGSVASLMFPALSLAVVSGSMFCRYVQGAGDDIFRNADYVRTARAKGAGDRRVLARHVMPNAILPLITVAGLQFAQLLGGSVIAETIFSLPGVGRLVITAIGERDYPVIQGGVLVITMSYVLLNLLVDMVYPLVDPRIRVGSNGGRA
mgnify:CR=1 FL=1